MMRNLAPGDLVKKALDLQSRLARMLHREYDAHEGYRFLRGPYHFTVLRAPTK